MESVKPINNNIYIELYGTGDCINYNSLKLFLDPAFAGHNYQPVVGKVVSIPEKFRFVTEDGWCPAEFDLKVGDEVVISRPAVAHRAEHSMRKNEEGNVLLFVRFHDLIAVKRGNEITPVNGYIFVDLIKETTTKGLIIGLDKKENQLCRGVVVAKSSPVQGYTHSAYSAKAMNKVQIGQTILFPKYAHCDLENPFQLKFYEREIKYIQSNQVIGTFTV